MIIVQPLREILIHCKLNMVIYTGNNYILVMFPLWHYLDLLMVDYGIMINRCCIYLEMTLALGLCRKIFFALQPGKPLMQHSEQCS